MSTLLKFLVPGLLVFGLLIWLGLPRLLVGLGFHRHYEVPALDLSGKRALIVATSHATLGEGGRPTGVAASELTAAYYAFADSGMRVDVASIQGGQIPIDPQTLRWPVISPPDRRYLKDDEAVSRVADSLKISEVDTTGYDIVYLAGGWGAAYDFGQSVVLGQKMADAHEAGAIVGGVCHGPLGFLQAKKPDGGLLIEGRRLTGVTDKQIRELGITQTPLHPERELRAAGVIFEADTAFRDLFADQTVVDGRIVTGQNQNSATETAVTMMQTLIDLSMGPDV